MFRPPVPGSGDAGVEVTVADLRNHNNPNEARVPNVNNIVIRPRLRRNYNNLMKHMTNLRRLDEGLPLGDPIISTFDIFQENVFAGRPTVDTACLEQLSRAVPRCIRNIRVRPTGSHEFEDSSDDENHDTPPIP